MDLDPSLSAEHRTRVLPLVLAEMPLLRRVAGRICRDEPELANDLVQETLLRALKSLHQWEWGTNMRAWLLTILRTQAISHHRRARRAVMVPFDALEEQLGVRGTQAVRLEAMAVTQAWDRLPPDYRRALHLVAIEGLRYQDAAERLSLPLGTVRSRISRARAALNQALAEGA
jgi:RNA polymerase sigma-70 factor (ECF subfamily)